MSIAHNLLGRGRVFPVLHLRKLRISLAVLLFACLSLPSSVAQTSYFAVLLPLPSGFDALQIISHDGYGFYGLGIHDGKYLVNLYNPSSGENLPAILDRGRWEFLNRSCFSNIYATNMYAGYVCGFGYSVNNCSCTNIPPVAVFYPELYSLVDLHPCGVPQCDGGYEGYVYSFALRTRSNAQVGYAHKDICTKYRAMLWFGCSTGYIDLHPADYYEESKAMGLSQDGKVQVGYVLDVIPFSTSMIKATVWRSTPVDFFFLPSNGLDSIAFNAWSNHDGTIHVVGVLIPRDAPLASRAALWVIKDDGFVRLIELHPSHLRVASSASISISHNVQVGYAVTSDGSYRAIRWIGTADTALDLNNFLPRSYQSWNAVAVEIDPKGNIIGFVWTGNTCKVAVWIPLRVVNPR